MSFWKKAWEGVVKYNPITLSADVVTGGKASEALGVGGEDSMLPGVSDVKGNLDDLTGKTAADAAEQAAKTAAEAETQKLNYLKEINKLPQEYKEKALTQLASVFGIGGDTTGQQTIINQAKASPLYSEIMGGLKSGEESIMRNAAMTGGLRSGNIQSALADYSTQLSNKALSDAYSQQLSGLTGLAGLNTGTSDIANTMSNIGQIQSQGILGSAQARMAATQNLLNTGLGIAGLLV